MVAGLAGACAHTNDSAAGPATSAWSPIHDDADDATASLGAGWTPSQSPGERVALMGDQADVTFTVTRAGAFDALLDAVSFQKPRRVQIDVDGKAIAPAFLISVDAGAPIVLPIGTFGFGSHQIHFESLDGADASGAGPRVSVAVRRLILERVGG